MMHILKNHPRHSHFPAQALMEAALILPLLLLLILGAMEFGRLYYTKMVLTNAAREGVNYYATSQVCKTSCTFSACSTGLKSVAVEAGASSGVTVAATEITLPAVCAAPGSSSSVTVTKSVTLMFGGFLNSFGLINSPFSISSTVTMVVQ
jgi:Flp pilus assembly protein TadG